ncbi:GLPGLI family protein [Lutibacter oricola]|uniref:GLPGLI family protein n=1 Tax=Lutibacter oricola TaxID=762486 RepID=A0A1H3B8K1_9FLAO|nr:GLPGLI family protein [Lutibacter oricola]SDX37369.1 GLPGLI family protein [Lutibacter oricola]
MKKLNIKVVLVLLLLLNTISLTAQELYGKVTYKQRLGEKLNDSIANKKYGDVYKNTMDFISESIVKNCDNFEYNLKFNRDESVFVGIKKLQNEADKGYKLAEKFSRVDDVFYLNIKSSQKLVQKESFGELFVIEYNLSDIKWELVNKTKVINNYKCFMATTTKIVKNSKGIFKKPVIAWYTTEIPLNFGPKGYGNLPGLILELQEDKLIFYATKIKLNPKKSIKIVKPNKGKMLTSKEFELRMKKVSKNLWIGR